jgi:uncharacterized protein (TIGR04168 family)
MDMRLGLVGDVHTLFDARDVAQLDASSYDALLFVGDLAGYLDDGRTVARCIATLATPALVMPGNHDAAPLPHLAAEAFGLERLIRLTELGQDRRCARLRRALGKVPLVGYSVHDLVSDDLSITVVAARPHSFGGTRLAFARHLASRHGIDSMQASTRRLRELVDAATHQDLVFLAHNGPAGLGDAPHSIWGRDFGGSHSSLPRDFGDPDLRDAIAYATSSGRRVRAVVAGHMHHGIKGGGERIWQLQRDDTLYVNAARVPRIRDGLRHHVRLSLSKRQAHAEAQLTTRS